MIDDVLSKIVIHIVTLCGVAFVIFLIFGICNNTGYYCDYCNHGETLRPRDVVESWYKNDPCMGSKDSCHHFTFRLFGPKEYRRYIK